MHSRQDKVAEVLKREISNIIQNELKDPRLGFITITRVNLSKDLKYAQIYFSVLSGEEEKDRTIEGLNSSTGFIRKLISERLKLRFTPEISFKFDRSVEYSIKLQQELDRIKRDDY
jgi:ribosome-binding factor A